MHAVKCRSSCLQASIAVSSDNSAAAEARTSRKYGRGSSFGLLGSVWVDSWVHPEGYSRLNRRAKRSLINELLLSYTPTRCNQYTLNSLQPVLRLFQPRFSVHSVQQLRFRAKLRNPFPLSRLLACETLRRPSAWSRCPSLSFPRGQAKT